MNQRVDIGNYAASCGYFTQTPFGHEMVLHVDHDQCDRFGVVTFVSVSPSSSFDHCQTKFVGD